MSSNNYVQYSDRYFSDMNTFLGLSASEFFANVPSDIRTQFDWPVSILEFALVALALSFREQLILTRLSRGKVDERRIIHCTELYSLQCCVV